MMKNEYWEYYHASNEYHHRGRRRLSRLALLYEKGQASELMDRTLDKLLTP